MEPTIKINVGKIIVIGLILLLLGGNVVLGFGYFNVKGQLKTQGTLVKNTDAHLKILAFGKLFVEKVLMSATPVDFNTRLELENMVRDTGDTELISQWQTFVNSQNETDAQTATVKLLDVVLVKANS